MEKLQPFWEVLLDVALYGMNIGPASLPQGSGEICLLKNLRKILHQKDDSVITVFDVGANIGEYASEALAFLGPSVRIFCFEPSHTAGESLRAHTQGLDAITVFHHGFGDTEEMVELFSDMAGSGLASVYDRKLTHQGIDLRNRETVRLTTIDRFCRKKGVDSISLLKVDVEGHEFKVFAGASEMIANNAIDVIQFEFGGCNIDSRTFFQDFFYLLNPKYRLFRLTVDGFVPIDHYNEKYEQFRTTNFAAVHRHLQ
jgi:FkbM family methyltransferase